MTLQQVIDTAGERPLLLLALLAVPPIAAWVAGRIHGQGTGGESPWRFIYAALVYLVCIPGLLAAVLIAYAMFFTGDSLLQVNILVYFLPIASMVATLVVMSRNVRFDHVPGFDRLWSLMLTIAIVFAIALAVRKTRIWLLFGASIWVLLLFAVAVFLLLGWSSQRVFGSRRERGLARD